MRATNISSVLQATFILLLGASTTYGCTNIDNAGHDHDETSSSVIGPGGDKKLQTIDDKKLRARHTQKKPKINIPLQCSKNVLTPAAFRTVTRRLKTFEGSPKYTNIPATIEWTNKRIQTAPARFPHETTPAVYREVTEEITILRSRTEVIGKPATYKTIAKPVTTLQSYTDWKIGCASVEPLECITRTPAKRKVLKQQFVDIPASVLQIAKPPETTSITRKILVSPGKGHGDPIPAEYQDIKIGRISKVWQVIAKPQPDQFTDVPVQVKVRSERIRPMPVLCYEQVEKKHMLAIQQRLQQRGYTVAMNGTSNQQTLQAIIQFQQDNKLSIGAITLETLRKLEIY